MFKKFFIVLSLLFFSAAYADTLPVEITPIEKISTCTKDFKVGNVYNFKNTATGEKITGVVTYYLPNGFYGQEAQIEISNFKSESGKRYSGKITYIPKNHENFQEFMNGISSSAFIFVRGSEIIILPNENKFQINNDKQSDEQSQYISIKPADELSTALQTPEIGDYVKFLVVNDVYKADKLFIKKGTPVYGLIDYYGENGWCFDNAVLIFKKFVLKDINGKNITIKNSELEINGFEILKYKSKRVAQFFNYMGVLLRGKEIDIKPYDTNVTFRILLPAKI